MASTVIQANMSGGGVLTSSTYSTDAGTAKNIYTATKPCFIWIELVNNNVYLKINGTASQNNYDIKQSCETSNRPYVVYYDVKDDILATRGFCAYQTDYYTGRVRIELNTNDYVSILTTESKAFNQKYCVIEK